MVYYVIVRFYRKLHNLLFKTTNRAEIGKITPTLVFRNFQTTLYTEDISYQKVIYSFLSKTFL